MENCVTYIKSIVENGWWEDACSSSYHSIPPVSAPGYKLQKPSKESGIFQSLGTINFVFFTKRQNQEGGAWPNRTQTHFRRHKHTARENQRYRSSAVKLASSSRTPRSLFSHPQGVRAPPIENRWPRLTPLLGISDGVHLLILNSSLNTITLAVLTTTDYTITFATTCILQIYQKLQF